MEAHWRHGNQLESDADLRAIAESVGLDGAAALAAADDPRLVALVDSRIAEAQSQGVTGIPTFVIGDEGNRQEVIGCQPYEVLAAAAERAGAVRRGPTG